MTHQGQTMGTSERRYMAVPELRMAEDGQTIHGYAAVFNSMSEDLGGFREIIAPGAFSETLNADVRALWNHDANHVLGRTKSGTLRLYEDQRGLRVEIDAPEAAGWMLDSMRRGDVDQMSFGFRTRDDEWKMEDGYPLRTLRKVDLFDVSVVTFPAYPETDAAVRSLTEFRQEREPVPDRSLALARLRLAEQSL